MTEITTEIIREITPHMQGLLGILRKLTNPAQASFDLGCMLIRQQLYKEALYRFKFTLWRQPRRAGAWYNLALCHFAQNEVVQGVAAVKKSLELNPKNEAALYLLATVKDGKYAEGHQPHTTPPEIIKSEFATRAATYEAEELGERGYIGHFSLYEEILPLLQGTERFGTLLDAGCGTGLLGDFLHPLCHTLVGMDISKDMLSLAHARKNDKGQSVYHKLLEGDVRSHLLHRTKPLYHGIAAANLAPLMGGLAPLIDGADRAVHPGGWLAFTVLPSNAPEGYELSRELKRFIHSEAYLQLLAQKFGFQLRLIRKPLYSRRDGWVVVMQKHA